jgi:hypothetical protein
MANKQGGFDAYYNFGKYLFFWMLIWDVLIIRNFFKNSPNTRVVACNY